jgi:hypothetical protein
MDIPLPWQRTGSTTRSSHWEKTQVMHVQIRQASVACRQVHRLQPAYLLLAIILFALMTLASCAPPYDETTDKQISSLQQETDMGLVRLISLANRMDGLKDAKDPISVKALADARAKAGFDANADFYDRIDTDLTSLQLRMTATPDLSGTSIDKSFAALQENLNDIRTFHSSHGVIGAQALMRVRTALNEQFRTLLQYELNLKSGKKAA